jgi:hypothetical protein
MNRLMDIKQDKDVFDIETATREEIEGFEEGTKDPPTLDPMRPFIQTSSRNSWNESLCELFIEQFQAEQGMNLTTEESEEIEDMFHARLGRLTRKWQEDKKYSKRQVLEREKISKQLARRNRRRLDVSQSPTS